MSIDTQRTPQEYEMLTGGGAESGELARRGLSRRQVLRRAVGLSLGLFGAVATYDALTMLYPNLTGQFGSAIQLQNKSAYPASTSVEAALGTKGVFYEQQAKAYIIHLQSPDFLLSGQFLQNNLDAQNWVTDSDNTYWLALFQVCVHLGCKYPFRDDCHSFKCPCHGSHYNIDGEYLDGPAPRSADRFMMKFSGGNVVVNTGVLNQHVARPASATRVLAPPTVQCSAT